MRKKGLALIAIIIIILFVAIGVLSTTGFIANRFSGFDVDQRLFRCTYAAQAGIQWAIYQYRAYGTLYAPGASGSGSIGTNNSFKVTSTSGGGGGGASSAIIINATASTLANKNKRVTDWTIQNNSASEIIINQVTITWSKTPKSLTSFVVNNQSRWSGSIASPPAVFSVNIKIPANTTYSTNNEINFNSSAAGDAGMTIAFRMTDNTITSPCTVYPQQPSACTQSSGSLTITSTGKTIGSTTLYKTYRATYDTSTNKISAYSELSTQVL